MKTAQFIFIYFCNIFFVKSGYPPTSDEVQVGSVLLPATRRGRYLANIVRRQAVDGTGIKFNKDADRMNAEAKKKVDVLSEELLPYIIAEQERRTTLYKRIMTAIQNGEKGVTIAEIRNKPPLIIRKGLMYRCPANRAPREPDGSGMIMCEDEIDPTPIMYDSCLSAEDKELYVAENKYFFCNRHKVEGPDLPRNGSTVIGCAPVERTSLNYTTSKCALEDSDDVVVHYRYYPDRTYKFVTELDPDKEVCDHWNPCQIGYIYSLPSPDQATQANELWRDYMEKIEDCERDEIIPPVPEDNINEFVSSSINYVTSKRKVLMPEGFTYQGIWKLLPDRTHFQLISAPTRASPNNMVVHHVESGRWLTVTITFNPFKKEDSGKYYLRLGSKKNSEKFKSVPFVTINIASTLLKPKSVQLLPGQHSNTTMIPFKCNKCTLMGVMLRASDGSIQNLDSTKYRMKSYTDPQGKQQKYIEMDLEDTRPQDFGDYFALIQNADGTEERIKILSIESPERDIENVLKASRLNTSSRVGDHYDNTINFSCDDCQLTDILCNGQTVLSSGRVSIIPGSKLISFNFPSFEDINSCVYIGVIKREDKTYRNILAVIENSSPSVTIQNAAVVAPPSQGEQFEHEIPFSCSEECSVEKVSVNGIALESSSRRSMAGSFAFYVMGESSITIRITEYSDTYEGVYQAVFSTSSGTVTKTILEIRDPSQKQEEEKVEATEAAVDTTTGVETTAAKGGETGGGNDKGGDAKDGENNEGETKGGETTEGGTKDNQESKETTQVPAAA